MSEQLRTARRSSALLHALSTDFLLREQFITDPVGMLSEYVIGPSESAEASNSANQLLYAIVSNSQMLRWLHERVAAPRQNLSDAALARDLAKAVARSGDEAVVAALIRCGAGDKAAMEPALGLLRMLGLGVRGLGQQLSGTQATPGTGTQATPGTGTQATPGTGTQATGTQATPGTGTQATPGTGTQATPGTGTQATPGTGTQATPGTGTQATPGTGTQATPGTGTQATPGTGTQATPGTGTQATPGTGTQATPGTADTPSVLIERWGEFKVTLEALLEYATQLRETGVLIQTGFE